MVPKFDCRRSLSSVIPHLAKQDRELVLLSRPLAILTFNAQLDLRQCPLLIVKLPTKLRFI